MIYGKWQAKIQLIALSRIWGEAHPAKLLTNKFEAIELS